MKKALSILILLSMLALPVVMLAEEAGDACAQAYVDAEKNVNTKAWWAAGFVGTSCLLLTGGVVAVALANTMKPYPSGTELLGKSSEYVEEYTYCYQKKGTELQTQKAINGALWGIPVWIVLYGGTILIIALSY